MCIVTVFVSALLSWARWTAVVTVNKQRICRKQACIRIRRRNDTDGQLNFLSLSEEGRGGGASQLRPGSTRPQPRPSHYSVSVLSVSPSGK